MTSFLCGLWPFVLGALLAWLVAGWLARRALAQRPAVVEKLVDRPVDRPVDRLVEKVVDNPDHLAQIASLTAAAALLPQLRAQLATAEAAPPTVVEKIVELPVEKIVERIVEVRVEVPVEKIVDREVERIVEKRVEVPVEVRVEVPVETVVEKVVERVVEVPVDNPSHLAQIASLTAAAALLPQLRAQLATAEAAPPTVVEKIVEVPVEKIVERIVEVRVEVPVEKIVDREVERIVEKRVEVPVEVRVEVPVETVVEKVVERVVEVPVADPTVVAELAELRSATVVNLEAAHAAGVKLKSPDDLEILDGIGPRVAQMLNRVGVVRFDQLAAMRPDEIQPILDKGGPSFKLAAPESWPAQAALASRNQWMALKSLKEALVRRPATVVEERVVEKRVEVPVQKLVERVVEKVVVDKAGLLARDQEIAALQNRTAALEADLKRWRDGPALDLAAAGAAGFKLKDGPDDLEIIEGIGPKIAELLRQAGIHRFWRLAQMAPAQLQPILDQAGANFKLAVPDTWPEQAMLAAYNHWRALKSLQDTLTAGVRK